MKNSITLIIAIFAGTFLFAQNAQVIVEKVDNGGMVPGNTYKVYVQLNSPNHSLHAVFGDDDNSMSIQSTSPFFQHQYGGQTTVDVNAAILDMAPEVAYDSWVTIGASDASNNNLWDIGINFDSFNAGGELAIEDGAWFLVPTDAYTLPSSGQMILVAQLTTEGTASGSLNIQGWDENLEPWQERELAFSTVDAEVFGCTDASASNYDSAATFNNGTCEFDGSSTTPSPSTAQESKDESNWQIFPNPIWEGQFNVQFSKVIDLEKGNMTLDIVDLQGKLVHSVEIDNSGVIGGNKLIVKKDLPAGLYNVTIRQGENSDTQQIVVQK
jgi:hypothetical protein